MVNSNLSSDQNREPDVVRLVDGMVGKRDFASEPSSCRHGETAEHHFTADDYPVPGLWWCPGPDGTHHDECEVVPMRPYVESDDDN